MSIKPILFNTEMVRAILDGRKTCTRRVVKGAEAQWCFLGLDDNATMIKTRANGEEYPIEVEGLWATFDGQDRYPDYPMIKSPYEPGDILWVRVKNVQVERLQSIDCAEALAEGCDGRCECPSSGAPGSLSCITRDFSIEKFEAVWDSTIKKQTRPLYGWAANPWVWVIEFERCEKPKEALNGK